MKEAFFNIIEGNNLLNTYRKILSIFHDNGLYREEAGLLERIYNITQTPEILLEIAEISSTYLKDNRLAQILLEAYILKKDPVFYEKFSKIFSNNNHNISNKIEIEAQLDNVNPIVEKYSALIYILIYFLKKKDFKTVIDCSNFLDYNELTTNQNEITDLTSFFSGQLSEVKHHNDINRLAIKMNPQNEKAYINILEDLLIYGNIEEGLNFYNYDYSAAFELPTINSITDLFWFISDKLGDFGDDFTAIIFQKKAIDFELYKKEKEGK